MPYIKLKNGEIELQRLNPGYENTDLIKLLSGYENYKYDREPVRQSDDIEKLFDKIVMGRHLVYVELLERIVRDPLYGVYDIDRLLDDGECIYGATWSDEGLIYRAKLVRNKDKSLEWRLL